MRQLVPAASLERSATQEYSKVLAEARAKGALAPDHYPQLQRLRTIAARLIPYAGQWNPRAKGWQWEVNLIGNKQINAWCMPGGKIAFYTGILDQLKLTDDEVAMVMGHEMAHALREHARERMAKNTATDMGLRLGAQLLGLGQAGDLAAGVGSQLLTLKYSRDDETEADLVGLEMAARCVVETGTSSIYRAIHTYTTEPLLKTITGHIKSDEVRHYSYFHRYFKRYRATEGASRRKVAWAVLKRIAEATKEDSLIAYKHAFQVRYLHTPFEARHYREYNRRLQDIMKRNFPFEMSIKMLMKLIDLPRRLQRPVSWVLVRSARRLVFG